ncbi:E3 ubiquitin-protein ligase TRIM39 [Channa argus]|uniref:E3 ubiquitin-protein ligase TRIM39 n=1 Tax=Channa argus TaxID=215402 RepID=A0A6G1QQ78_CHAAH|nr:E3 ubiquitin-protein ligase TRIM39 [Channa argus]
MMKDCLQFLIEPAKKLKIRLKESRKRVKLEKKEPLVESQLFIMELARELNKICQRSNILSHIWTSEDLWPASLCRDFIVEWAAVVEERVQPRIISSDYQYEKPEKKDWKGHLLCMLEAGGECDMGPHKRVIMDWMREIKSRTQVTTMQDDEDNSYFPPTVWPGEPVLMMLDDLEFQWKRGRLPNLLPAMELVMLAVLNAYSSIKTLYATSPTADVTLDSDSANPDLLISSDEKRMRCGLERRDAPRCQQRFDGWWCAAGQQGYTSGRHYWEVEVGERDWRLGVAKASAVRRGFRSLNTDTGYLTLRLERGTDLKAMTVPATLLPQSLVPRKVGVYLDYEQGQLSFYDVEKRSHLYTFNQKFNEELYPVFGTVEVVKDLVIRPADVRQPCLCPGPCLWN